MKDFNCNNVGIWSPDIRSMAYVHSNPDMEINPSRTLKEMANESKEDVMASRRVLITGASKGIGRAVAERVAAGGNVPIGLARTRPEYFPGDFYEVDLTDRTATAAVLERIVASGPIEAVVNNVGFARFGRIGEIDLDDLSEIYDLNVRTTVQVVQAVLPGMKAAGWGRIVNVTSMTTLGTPERTPYAAAKAALEACTRIWANELASAGITVNAVAPGPTETELYRERSPIGSEREARFLETIPLHRVGTPREIAHAICALLDEDAGYITGQIVRADGGGSIAA
jgi:NAD(P)-dependent dehydrogenase (short-subunit alcohol dehydrogenase family)